MNKKQVKGTKSLMKYLIQVFPTASIFIRKQYVKYRHIEEIKLEYATYISSAPFNELSWTPDFDTKKEMIDYILNSIKDE
jgi:hypothetical protein